MRDFKLPNFADKKKSWSLSDKELFYLDMSIVLPKTNHELYRLISPDLSEAQCKNRSAALNTSYDGKEYLELRRKQLTLHFYPDKDESKRQVDEDGFSIGFKDKVIRILENELNNPGSANFSDALKIAANKIVKDFDKQGGQEPPRRYLPETCGSCRYKLFVESNLEIDQCKICKYREFGNDNDVFYDYKNQLDTNINNEEE